MLFRSYAFRMISDTTNHHTAVCDRAPLPIPSTTGEPYLFILPAGAPLFLSVFLSLSFSQAPRLCPVFWAQALAQLPVGVALIQRRKSLYFCLPAFLCCLVTFPLGFTFCLPGLQACFSLATCSVIHASLGPLPWYLFWDVCRPLGSPGLARAGLEAVGPGAPRWAEKKN